MRVLFVGLGSIGKRHIKNLSQICEKRGIELSCDALRTRGNELPNEIENLIDNKFKCYEEIEDIYDIAFITNPTSLHKEAIEKLKGKAKNFFIEKPVFCKETMEEGLKLDFSNGVHYVAAPLRYNSAVKSLADYAKENKIIAIRAITSSYLPAWRPGTDYRDCYSAKKEEGGGVSIDLVHEWDYITSIFGFPKAVRSIIDKKSALEINSDDIAIYIAEYDNMTVELHLDYFGRATRRECEVFTDDESIVFDIAKNKIKNFETDKVTKLSPSEIYIEEMNSFLDMVLDGKKNTNTPQNAADVLRLSAGEDI